MIDLTLLGLLPELVLRILAYLDPGSLCQVSLTCTYLKSLADSQVPLPSSFHSLPAFFISLPYNSLLLWHSFFPFTFIFVPRPGWFLWFLLEIP